MPDPALMASNNGKVEGSRRFGKSGMYIGAPPKRALHHRALRCWTTPSTVISRGAPIGLTLRSMWMARFNPRQWPGPSRLRFSQVQHSRVEWCWPPCTPVASMAGGYTFRAGRLASAAKLSTPFLSGFRLSLARMAVSMQFEPQTTRKLESLARPRDRTLVTFKPIRDSFRKPPDQSEAPSHSGLARIGVP